jgi:CheY-like chemotaxis protein
MLILIAEDDLDISALYKKALEKRKHSVVLTYTGEACLENYLDAFHNTKSPRKYNPEVTTKKLRSCYHPHLMRVILDIILVTKKQALLIYTMLLFSTIKCQV